jgi:glycosyltransferase involved in cell wall biosynthesis
MRVAIVAPFGSFADSYSLTHVVRDQARALRFYDCQVEVWVLDSFPDEQTDIKDLIVKCIPTLTFEKDVINPERVGKYNEVFRENIRRFSPDCIVAHDLIFQSYYIDFAASISILAPEFKDVLWLHYVHSVLNLFEPIDQTTELRRTLPDGHWFIYPNKSIAHECAEYFGVDESKVHSLPNPRDPRSCWGVSPDCEQIVTDYGVLFRDVVQVLPFCTTRMKHKGLEHTIELFNNLEKMGKNPLLICCNASANGEKEKQAIKTIKDMVRFDIVFTSELKPEWELGLPNKLVSELFRFSNVFCYFSIGEVCSLVLAEAQMAGCLCLLNNTVDGFKQYAGDEALWQDFDSLRKKVTYQTEVEQVVEDLITKTSKTVKSVLHGKESYQAMMQQLAVQLVERLEASYYHQTRSRAFKTYSREVHGARLLEIIARSAGDL